MRVSACTANLLVQALGPLDNVLRVDLLGHLVVLLEQIGVFEKRNDLSPICDWFLVETFLLGVADIGRDDLIEGELG